MQANCVTAGPGGWDSQRRTHTLSDGGKISDFAGNVWEWSDWNVPIDKACPVAAFQEFTACITYTTAMPAASFKSANSGLGSANGIGQYYAALNGAGGAALAGGDYSLGVAPAGVFALSLGEPSTRTGLLYGFRCALVPN